MTASTTDRPARRQPPWAPGVPAQARSGSAVRPGQLVAMQVAMALPVAAYGRGPGPAMLAAVGAVVLTGLGWGRWRGRWLFDWWGTAAGYVTRRRGLPADAAPAALLDLVLPDAVLGPVELAEGPAGVVDDALGLTVLLDLGDPGDLLGDRSHPLPAPGTLLPPAGPEQPPVRVQLLLHAVPAPAAGVAGGTAGTSYRQLTEGRLPGQEQALLAVRVLRVPGWSDADLRRALAGTVRRIVRRVGPVPARPLGEHAALRVLCELAHHDGGREVRETWSMLRTGNLCQATFRLVRWPDARVDPGRRLVARLLALPATATSVSLCAGPRTGGDATPTPAELTVRLAAATPAELELAAEGLCRIAVDAGGELRRLDGAHLPGLAATLPLAVPGVAEATTPGTEPPELTLDAAGLMVGANRHGGAVTVRLFRAEGTRLVLVGGLAAAQLLVLRAVALGAGVVVQTGRPRAWEPFVRGVGGQQGGILVVPTGRAVGVAGSPLRPLLVVNDAGTAAGGPTPGAGWVSTLVVRDELTPADVDTLGRADLAVLQPLDPQEAALAGTALGLGGSAEWLTRIRDDMVAVVNRRALRWALLSPTPIESQLVGRPGRR
ncbi:type VII secretion protein EccE [Micromonospora sp. NPDC051925]|uniref:type VII secretion protein EccE n=1 Tax=Micromonospora sp. NPDC051925 TaxID=3364288 RepID=UPI0037C9509E